MNEKDPFNITLLDVKKFIKDFNVMEVTSAFIRESSSNQFHPEGLFSEQIFGQIASEKRSRTSGYISLNCRVFHPIIFQNLVSIKKFYGEIMAGTSYAIWDVTEGDFIRSSASEEGADTGYTFFLNHIDQINFKKNNSFRRNDKIEVVEKYKDLRLVDKLVVIPAGIRDMRDDAGKMEKDSINSLYASLMSNTRAMTQGADKNPLFDSVHYIIQKKVVEIYEYLSAMVRGKGGFFEGKYQHRNIARATRNVVTATNMDATDPDSPQYHKIDETKVPLYQAAKGAANALVYWYKTIFYDQVINMSSDNIPLINPDNLRLEYVQVDSKDRDKLLTSEGIERTIDRFRDPFNRFKPVTAKITTSTGKSKFYYLFMVYDLGDRVYIVRNVDEFKTLWERAGKTYDAEKMRPLTNAEMLYIAAYSALKGTYATVTRYPVLDNQGIYVSKTHLMSTVPARIVRLCRDVDDTPDDIVLPEYPILGKKFVDALMLHPTRLKSLGADFDGNCLVGETEVEVRFTDEFIESCEKYCSKDCKSHIDALVSVADSRSEEGWNYAVVRLDAIPHSESYTLDKNGAKVYELPEGLQVLSYYKNVAEYMPVEKITIEDDCPVVEITAHGKTAVVSTNASLAAFNRVDGVLAKMTPKEVHDLKLLIPVLKTTPRFDYGLMTGTLNDFKDGYEAAVKLAETKAIGSFRPHCLVSSPLATAVGMVCGFIDTIGGCKNVINDYTSGSTFINAENAEVRKVIIGLLYVAGIDVIRVDPVEDLAYTIYISAADIASKNIPYVVKTPSVAKTLEAAKRTCGRNNCDLVPVTPAEYDRLKVLATQTGSYSDVLELLRRRDLVYPRHMLKRILKKHDTNDDLSNRVFNDNVLWSRISASKHETKRTVYDLIVPDSKVFAVNNGVVVYDTCSWIPIFSKEANEQCAAYTKSTGNYLLPSGDTIASMCDDLCHLAFYSLLRDPPELKKK